MGTHLHPHCKNLLGKPTRLRVLAGPSRLSAPTSLGTHPTSPWGWYRDEGQAAANQRLVTSPLWGTVGYEVAVIQRSMANPHSGKTSSHTAPLSPGTAPASLPTPKPRQEKQVAPGSALIHPDCHWDEPAVLGFHLHPRSWRRDHHGPHSGATLGRFKSCARLTACSTGCTGWRGSTEQVEHVARRVRGFPRAGIPNFLRSLIF